MTKKQFRDVENTLMSMITAKNKAADVVLSAVETLVFFEQAASGIIEEEKEGCSDTELDK